MGHQPAGSRFQVQPVAHRYKAHTKALECLKQRRKTAQRPFAREKSGQRIGTRPQGWAWSPSTMRWRR
jgi:hypothetical protein